MRVVLVIISLTLLSHNEVNKVKVYDTITEIERLAFDSLYMVSYNDFKLDTIR